MHHSPWLVQLCSESFVALDLSCTMKVLLTTCLLFALLPTVASLKCYRCEDPSGFPSCLYLKMVECANNEDGCLSWFSFIYNKRIRYMGEYTKACVDSKSWSNGSYLITTALGYTFLGNTEVCHRDLCNNQEHDPETCSDHEKNGRKCPACLTFDSDECEGQNTISCLGDETKCLYASAMAKGPEGAKYYLALKGCATPNLCNIQKGELFGSTIANITRLKCTNAKMCPTAVEGNTRISHLLWSLPFMRMK